MQARLSEEDPFPPEDRAELASLEALYRAHRPTLTRALKGRVAVDQAEDLIHQTFVRWATLSTPQRRVIRSPLAYLRTVARNLALDDRRWAERRLPDFRSDDGVADLASCDPVAALEARDLLRRIEAATLKMKPRTREIFLAHRVQGWTYLEIAEHTGLSVKGVEKQMSKAIAHIDRVLKQQFQIQTLMAAQYRAETLDATRRAQAEGDARAATTKFLGSGSAYTPQ